MHKLKKNKSWRWECPNHKHFFMAWTTCLFIGKYCLPKPWNDQ